MPIYEFECLDCGRRTTALVLTRARIGEVRCRNCGGARLEKLFSRFAMPRSEESRLEALADPSALGDVDEHDPASVARWMKKMGKELGEDMGSDFEEALEEGMSGRGEEGEESGEGGEEL